MALSSYTVSAGLGESLAYDFVATTATTALTFMDASGFDSNAGWTDNVSVVAVPEPAMLAALAAVGLFGAGGWLRRRSQRS